MPIEGQVASIADLNPTYPQADDPISQGDNHVRNIKKAITQTFPNVDNTVNASEDDLNKLVGESWTSDIEALQSSVSENRELIDGVNDNVVNLGGDVSTNADAISALQGQVGSNDSDIGNLSGRVSQNETDIDSLQSGVSANASAIATKAEKSYVDDQIAAIPGAVAYEAGTNLNKSGTTFNVNTTLTGLTDVETTAVSFRGANFEVVNSGQLNLIIKFQGSEIFRLDSSGNLTVKGNVTAYGSP